MVGNVIGAVVGTKGAGAAVKGDGTAAKAAEVGGKAGQVVGSTLEGIGGVAMKAGQLKVNLTDSLATKMAGLGNKLQIPKFGPEPAFAGAGGRGASQAFDVTPGSRTASSTSVTARIDDGVAPSSRAEANSATPPCWLVTPPF